MSSVEVTVTAPNQITVETPGPAGVGVPAGGTTGQVLAKNSNTDYDTTWVTGGGLTEEDLIAYALIFG